MVPFVAVGWYRYQTSATHVAEPLCQRTIVLTVPQFRYEKTVSVNLRYQNIATGGTKSPILSATVDFDGSDEILTVLLYS